MVQTGARTPLHGYFAGALNALKQVPTAVAEYDSVDDDTLIALHRLAAAAQSLAGALLALTAGQIAHRSVAALGSEGLARRGGYRTPEEMVRVTGGTTGQDAVRAVRAGRIIRDTQTAGTTDPTTGQVVVAVEPWLAAVGRALTVGLSTAAAEAIRTGLGKPAESVTVGALAAAAVQLVEEAAVLDPDRLFRRARQLRDELDAQGIGEREEERRNRRSLRLLRLPNGMGRLLWDLDPETLAIVADCYDRVTSPRRGGPRFVDTEQQQHADRILEDTRTTEQLASDTFSQLLQHGVATDPTLVLGTGTPSVRILTLQIPHTDRTGNERASSPGAGHSEADTSGPGTHGAAHGQASPGWIEGQPDPVSPETVARLTCTGTTTRITVSTEGQPLDVGREQRLFTRAIRIGLAVRDGGCTWGNADGTIGCDRPPSWTEAHHVAHWHRDHGPTTIENGILLCRYHHLLLHNHGWEIIRDGIDYWLIPPKKLDPLQTPRRMPSKSQAMKALVRLSAHAGGTGA